MFGRFTQCVSSYAKDRTSYARPFHLYRGQDGAWHKMEIPVALNSSGRSQIVLDANDDAYVVAPFDRVVTASGWTDWAVKFDGSGLNAFGEVIVDRSRVASEGILSIMNQRSSSGTTPSPVRVVDLRLS